MLTIYHVPGTRSFRPIWVCEELGVPYQLERIDFAREFRFSSSYLRLNPLGKVPVLMDDDFTMYESGAMVQFILERYGNGRLTPKPGTPDSAMYLQWSWFAEATFARPLGDMMQHTRLKPPAERLPAMVEDGKQRAMLCINALEAALTNRDYLVASTFGAADIQMGYSLLLAQNLELMTSAHPRLLAYHQRLAARPGYAVAKS